MKDCDRKQQPGARCPGQRLRWTGCAWTAPVLLLCLGLPASLGQAQDKAAHLRPAQMCADQPAGAACWMELASPAGCYVWTIPPPLDASGTWSGACAEGRAQGEGSLTVTWVSGEDKMVFTSTGRLQNGKRHGSWVWRTVNGDIGEGPFVEGQQQGHWILRAANGTVEEGPFVEGQRHGPWVLRFANGNVWEGPYHLWRADSTAPGSSALRTGPSKKGRM